MIEIPDLHRDAIAAATDALAGPGDWLTGAQRLAVWAEVRDAATNPIDRARIDALSPYGPGESHQASDLLPAAGVEVAHRVATDPGRLTRSWAEDQMRNLGERGEEIYTEIVAVTAMAVSVDRFTVAVGSSPIDLPSVVPGEPARIRPGDVGDVGAWVSQALEKGAANVSRAVSLLPLTGTQWRRLVNSLYSRGAEFLDLEWDRPLSRPQVELVAARTTALNECFY